MKTHEINKFRKTYQPYVKGCCFEGYKLAVLFDEKDAVKRIGGMWSAQDKIWWMPADLLQMKVGHQHLAAANWSGIIAEPTILEYLNHYKMILGQFGDFDYNGEISKDFVMNIDDIPSEIFQLSRDNQIYSMRIYPVFDIAHVFETTGNSGKYMHREDGRNRWEELVKEGYNRTINA
jgi:hypothetical protein